MKTFTKQRDTVDYLQERKQRIQAQFDAGDVFPCGWDNVEKLIFEIDFEAKAMPEFTKYVIAEKPEEYEAEMKNSFYCDEDGSDYFKTAVIYKEEDEDPYILIFVDTSWLDHREE